MEIKKIARKFRVFARIFINCANKPVLTERAGVTFFRPSALFGGEIRASMAPKRPAPAEQPPPAESSGEDEASSESTGSEEEEEEDPSDSDEPKSTQQKAPPPKPSSAPPPRANSTPHKSAPSSESESDSESEPESESESESDSDEPKGKPPKTSRPTAVANAKPQKSAPDSDSGSESDSDVTPLAAKPMEGQSTPQSKRQNLKRPRSELTVAADDDAKTPSKKLSNATSRASQSTGEESSKKLPFQRVWSEEDEVTLLKGMIEYWEKRGVDPSTNIISFHEFIKDRLRLDAVPGQLTNKIRSLKKRFKNNEAKAKNGKDCKPSLQQAFDLSVKLWGSEHGIMKETSNPKASANGTTSKKKKKKSAEDASSPMVISLSPQRMVKDEDNKAIVKAENWNSDATQVSLCEDQLSCFLNGRVDDRFLRSGLGLISDSKREELEERWKKLNLAELQVLSEKALMIHEQINLILDAYKKP